MFNSLKTHTGFFDPKLRYFHGYKYGNKIICLTCCQEYFSIVSNAVSNCFPSMFSKKCFKCCFKHMFKHVFKMMFRLQKMPQTKPWFVANLLTKHHFEHISEHRFCSYSSLKNVRKWMFKHEFRMVLR